MKITLYILFFLGEFSFANCQNRANIWMMGVFTFNGGSKCGIEFTNIEPDTFSIVRDLPFYLTNAAICDTTGALLFYTNGTYIANRNNDSLYNCLEFNKGFVSDLYFPDGLGVFQGAIVLPKPSSPTEYYVVSTSGEQGDFYGKSNAPIHLSCSKIDMTLDGGLGGIVPDFKNVFLVEDTLVLGRLTACKHANGRDWWLISHKFYSDRYFKFLITPDTISGPYSQDIGSFVDKDIVGMSVFSPDGSKFACLNPNDTLDIFSFDRCTGEFSDPVKILLPDSLSTSCSFSPNSRFLYATQFEHLYQLDMWATDIPSSLITIAEYDGWTDPESNNLPPYFSLNQLAPDGKIYICSWHSTKILHVINSPDELGAACDFQQHSFKLPRWNYNMPNFPNYDLSALDNSACDTLYLNIPDAHFQNVAISYYPNPVSTWLNIVYQLKGDALFELFDENGAIVKSIMMYPYFKNRLIDVSDISSGMYVASVFQKGKKIWSDKIVVVH